MRNANPKLRLKKGLLLSGDEFYYSARPTTTPEDFDLVSKEAKGKKSKSKTAVKDKKKTVATATKPPVLPRPLREKARSSQEKAARERKG
ncbi:hypothetical protein EON76_06785 [bacterium]|nr:MAG: hypothetical protein EON76_06785 [bacterium]